MPIKDILKAIGDAAGDVAAPGLIDRALTLDERVPLQQAMAALADSELFALHCVESLRLPLTAGPANTALAFWPHGKLAVLPASELQEGDHVLGHVQFDDALFARFQDLRRTQRTRLEAGRAPIAAQLDELGWDAACAEVGRAIEHMAPLIYYLGDHCASNFYDVGKSDSPRESTLQACIEDVRKRREGARIESLTVVLCLLVLLRSGANYRAEEMNSGQLSLATLDRFLDDKREYYAQFDDSDTSGAPWDAGTPPLAKAAWLAAMRKRIAQSYRLIRTINGLNLRKKEVVFTGPAVDDIAAAPYHKLAAVQRSLSRWMAPALQADVQRWLGTQDLPPGASPRFASHLEYLIDAVIAQAVAATRSDLGMTRGVRDFKRFALAHAAREGRPICDGAPSDYFCHVVPGADLAGRCSAKALGGILNAVSARMRYNAWHYTPSYFPEEQIAAERGWFFAPRMADLTLYSDYHHAGHVHARVRYCIRSPFAIRAGREILPGFADLRLMRQNGAPYDLTEFATALACTEVLQFLYQKLMDHLLGTDAAFAFSFGDKAWFDRAGAAQGESVRQPALA